MAATPLAVTIAEPSVDGQAEMARAAERLGAGWVILQPPPVAGLPEIEYVRFLGAVADRVSLPVAVQNAPGYLGVSLSNAGLRELARQHPNVCLLKGEGPAVVIRRLIEDTQGAFRVLNGRGGLELPDNLRAGCVGLIPAPECFDVQVRIFELMRTGRASDEAEAERLYRDVLPLIVFLMQSVESFLCYGKRVTARRLGLGEVHDRQPALAPTAFGLASAERYAARLGPYGAASALSRRAVRSPAARCPRACSPPGTDPPDRSRAVRYRSPTRGPRQSSPPRASDRRVSCRRSRPGSGCR